jgi:hypothetical protein
MTLVEVRMMRFLKSQSCQKVGNAQSVEVCGARRFFNVSTAVAVATSKLPSLKSPQNDQTKEKIK